MDETEYPHIGNINELMAIGWNVIDPQTSRQLSGVYLLRDRATKKIVYAGRSARIGKRLLLDQHPVYNPVIHDVLAHPVKDQKTLWYLEAIAINLLRPEH